MPATPDRTTIHDAFDALISQGRASLVAVPPTPVAPFYRLVVGLPGDEAHPRPFLASSIVAAETIGVVDDDKIIRVTIAWRVVTDVSQADAHAQIVDKIGAVEDFFDGRIQSGILEGAEGLDQRSWRVDFPAITSGARVVSAVATQSMIVKVERNWNRIPAS